MRAVESKDFSHSDLAKAKQHLARLNRISAARD